MSEPIQSCIKACAVQDELRHVRALLQLEQKEEQAQFKQQLSVSMQIV